MLPFSPNYAFVLFPNKNISKFLLDDKQLGIITVEKKEIELANKCALISEQNSDNEFVVAKKEQELIDLIPHVKWKAGYKTTCLFNKFKFLISKPMRLPLLLI